jgi:hypothetical protein
MEKEMDEKHVEWPRTLSITEVPAVAPLVRSRVTSQ